VFVAVPLPEAASAEVTGLVETVRAAADPTVRDVRWVRLDGLHLTLRFIGPVEEDGLAEIARAMDAVAAEVRPFDVAIEGAGAFPSMSRPRAIWLGVTAGADRLAAAASILEDGLVSLGLERDGRPYRAHLTLARADGIPSAPAVARRLVDAADGRRVGFGATEIVLYETIQGGGPARYVRLLTTPLGADPTVRNEDAPAGTR
jgi:2'-5' RNA ligase